MKHITVAEPSLIEALQTIAATNLAPVVVGVAICGAMLLATIACKLGWAG